MPTLANFRMNFARDTKNFSSSSSVSNPTRNWKLHDGDSGVKSKFGTFLASIKCAIKKKRHGSRPTFLLTCQMMMFIEWFRRMYCGQNDCGVLGTRRRRWRVCECLEEMMMTRKILYGISGKFLLCWHEYVSRSLSSPCSGNRCGSRIYTIALDPSAQFEHAASGKSLTSRQKSDPYCFFSFSFLSQKHNQRSAFGEIFTDFAAKAGWRWGVWWTLNSLATQIARARYRNLIRFVGTTRIFFFDFVALSTRIIVDEIDEFHLQRYWNPRVRPKFYVVCAPECSLFNAVCW